MSTEFKALAAKNASDSLFKNVEAKQNLVPPAYLATAAIKISRLKIETLKKFSFDAFYHPYSELLLETLNKYGFPSIFSERILDKSDEGLTFKNNYNPNDLLVNNPYAKEEFAFDIDKPYAQDNWMTFYHIIILIVETLLSNNKNDEAITWIEQCLYDPKTLQTDEDSNDPSNAKYWKLPVFKSELTESTTLFFKNISNPELQKLVSDLDANPFNPFLVAYRRPQEFMMYVVNLYVKAHIAQGDVNFRMAYNGGGMDYLNLALDYYKVAKVQLGDPIETIPNILKKKPESYQSLKIKDLKPDVNALVQFENIFPFCSQALLNTGSDSGGSLLGGGYTFYFSIPPDKATNELHDLINDRLTKLRNCRDIDGIVRKIDLFGTPINPAQLLAALAKGLSLNEILGSMFAPPPLYKLSFSMQKAKEICAELKSLGSAIVSAIEKGNTEELAHLQATHELDGLNRLLPLKQRQVYQSQLEKQSLLKSRSSAENKLNYYKSLLGLTSIIAPLYKDLNGEIKADSPLPNDTIISSATVDVDVSLVDTDERGVKIIPQEKNQIDDSKTALKWQDVATGVEGLAGALHLVPDFTLDAKPFGIGPGTRYGGGHLGSATSALAKIPQIIGAGFTHSASQSSQMASYIRREQEWAFQLNQAAKEIVQIDKNLAVSDIKIQSAEIELANLTTQITESQTKKDFLTTKETHYQIYYGVSDKLKTIHKNYYDLAMYYARSAEQAYQFEQPSKTVDFIRYNYDNSLLGCATIADDLSNSLNQMEKSYLEDTIRPLEMRINIQLSRLDPMALMKLRKEGKATVSIPEWLLLLKNRGVYNARIISANFTFPMITGPYTNINARVKMTKNLVRVKPEAGDKFEMQPDGDARFIQRNIPFDEVLITSGVNDSGYNLDAAATSNEPYQHQYRPFEQAGAICDFEIDLNGASEKFNFNEINRNTLSEMIISAVLSVEIDKGTFKDKADEYLTAMFKKFDNKALSLLVDIKHDLPNDTYKYTADTNAQSFNFTITQDRFPYIVEGRKITLTTMQVITKDNLIGTPIPFDLQNVEWKKSGTLGNGYQIFVLQKTDGNPASINIIMGDSVNVSLNISKDNVSDSFLVFGYSLDQKA